MSVATEHPIVIDPEFKNLIPPLTEEERAGLEEAILREGCTDPLRVWRTEEGDVLIDGFNRESICRKHNLPYQVEIVEGLNSREDVKRWMIGNQFSRRNLGESQRSMLATRLAGLENGQKKSASPIGEASQAEVAEIFHVGKRSVERARYVIEKGIPELSRLVTEGKVAVSAAADVAGLPKEEQAKIVAGGAETIIVASRKIRQNRKSATQESGNPQSSATVEPDGLLPCAHCGSPAKYESFFDILRGNLHYAICTNEACNIQTPNRKKKEDVQAIWNLRSKGTA